MDYIFPRPGKYLLFADITPFGNRNQIFRIPVSVAGIPPHPQPLFVTPARAKVFGPYRGQLLLTPRHLVWNDKTVLIHTIWKNGLP